MSRLRCLVIGFVSIVMVAFASGVQAQEACPSSKTLPEMMKALDAAISGPSDKDRTCLRSLFLPDATLTVMMTDKSGVVKPVHLSVDDWIERVKKRGSAPMYERQIKFVTESYGNIAHLWSLYEIHETPDGPMKTRGVNSIQALNDGAQWKVVEVLWQAETPNTPIPAELMP